MDYFAQSELESIKNDARSSEGKTPQDRMAMFADLLETVDLAESHARRTPSPHVDCRPVEPPP